MKNHKLKLLLLPLFSIIIYIGVAQAETLTLYGDDHAEHANSIGIGKEVYPNDSGFIDLEDKVITIDKIVRDPKIIPVAISLKFGEDSIFFYNKGGQKALSGFGESINTSNFVKPGEIYTITHGEKTWTLNFKPSEKKNKNTVAKKTDVSKKTQNEGGTLVEEKDKDKASSISWWIWIIVAVVLIFGVLFFVGRKGKNKNKVKKEVGEDNGKEDKQVDKTEDDDKIVIALRKLLDKSVPNHKDMEIDDILSNIKNKFKKVKGYNEYSHFCKIAGINKNLKPEAFLSKVRELLEKNNSEVSADTDIKKKSEDGGVSAEISTEKPKEPEAPKDWAKELADKLDSLISGYNGMTDEEKCTAIQEKIKREDELRDEKYSGITDLLDNVGKNSSKEEIIAAIRKLKEKTDGNSDKNKVSESDIYRVFKDYSEGAIHEAYSNAKSDANNQPVECLRIFLINISNKFATLQIEKDGAERKASEYNSRASEAENRGITIVDLNDNKNATNVRSWLVGKLTEKGLSVDASKSLSEIFDQIKDWKNRYDKGGEETIINKAIESDGGLTDAQKNKLIVKLVGLLNGKLEDDDKIAAENLGDFIDAIVDKITTPVDVAEAKEKVRKDALNVVNAVLGGNIGNLDDASLKEAAEAKILNTLNDEISGLDAETLEAAITRIKVYSRAKKERDEIVNEYGAEGISKLPYKIIEKNFKDTVERSKDKLASIGNVNSLTDLINKFDKKVNDKDEEVKAAKEAQQKAETAKQNIVNQLDVEIAKCDNTHRADAKNAASDLLNKYVDLRNAEKSNLESKISKKESEIEGLNSTISQKNTEIVGLKDTINDLKSESDNMIATLKSDAERLLEAADEEILIACSSDADDTCNYCIQNLKDNLKEFADRLTSAKIDTSESPSETRAQIQSLLKEMIDADGSVVSTIGRYYTYGRLPFMTDERREYGIRFDRRNLNNLYDKLELLLSRFGIRLSLPALFATGFSEGDFEDVTGKEYSELDNLCPNSRNHYSNIDAEAKPDNVVIDIIKVGYTIDNKGLCKTTVLTFR